MTSICFKKNIFPILLIANTVLSSGCAHSYTINVTDDKRPVPDATYYWHLARKCRTGLDGEGKTDELGDATFKSYPHAKVYVIKEDKWGSLKLQKGIYLYSLELKHQDVRPMGFTEKSVFGIEMSPEEIPKRGNY